MIIRTVALEYPKDSLPQDELSRGLRFVSVCERHKWVDVVAAEATVDGVDPQIVEEHFADWQGEGPCDYCDFEANEAQREFREADAKMGDPNP